MRTSWRVGSGDIPIPMPAHALARELAIACTSMDSCYTQIDTVGSLLLQNTDIVTSASVPVQFGCYDLKPSVTLDKRL